MDISPTKDCVFVRPDLDKHELFVLLKQNKTGMGDVVSIGPEVEGLVVGDKVLFGEFVGQEFKWQSEDLLVMREAHVLGTIDA